jgi:hypothetical protein
VTESGSTPPPPPGWYDDPWGSPTKRWWDGQAWTGHLQAGGPVSSVGVPLDQQLEAEQGSARWARLAMLWAGPAYAIQTVAATALGQQLIENLRSTDWGASSDSSSGLFPSIGNPAALAVNQLASLAYLAGGVLFLVWFYRSVTLARDAGLPARRSPGLALAAWIIPIVNWWWPYQSVVDVLPRDHPGQPQVLRWWLLWIAASNVGIVAVVVGFASVAAMWITGAVGAGLSLAAAFAARDVVELVVHAHAGLVRR